MGDGPERDAIAQAIARQPNANSIHMLGPLAHADVFRAMEAADAFVMISEKETFGMVYVEAMSRGAIPIGSRGEGIDGVVRDGQNGFLLPAGDKDALARLFERLHAMPAEEVRALSQNAWESVEALRADKLAESVLASLRVRETPRSLVFFTRGYPTPGMPSHQVFVARLARAMADCGADVRVIYPVARHRRRKEKAPFLFTERTEQGNRVEVFCPSRANLLWYPLTAWRFERAALREMRRRGLCPDAIYAHFAVPPGTAAARAAKNWASRPSLPMAKARRKLLKQYARAARRGRSKAFLASSPFRQTRPIRWKPTALPGRNGCACSPTAWTQSGSTPWIAKHAARRGASRRARLCWPLWARSVRARRGARQRSHRPGRKRLWHIRGQRRRDAHRAAHSVCWSG